MQDIRDFIEWRPRAKEKLESVGFQVNYDTYTKNKTVVDEEASSIEFESGTFTGTIIVYDWQHIEVQMFFRSDGVAVDFSNLIEKPYTINEKLDAFLERILQVTRKTRET